MLYLYLNHAIYGIDMTSNENMVVADALEEGGFAVSSDKARIAWADGGKAYEAETLHLMDLETGEKRDIRGGADEICPLPGLCWKGSCNMAMQTKRICG